MDTRKLTLRIIVFMFVLALSVSLSANVSIVRESSDSDFQELIDNQDNSLQSTSAAYTGNIKVHIVEPLSRWGDSWGTPYRNAHLFYALQTDINIADASGWETTFTFDASTYNFGDVEEDNIASIIAVFNDDDILTDAYSPNGYWFYANYSDASAMAYPGILGMNETAEGFTHSVYIEEGTATW